MKLSLSSLVLALSLAAGACAAPSSDADDRAAGGAGSVEGTNESDFTSGDRKAQLDGLRARVQQDFAGAKSLAVLEKNADGKWSIMKKGSGDDALEAYVVGPTDVAYEGWDREFGIPRAWLGL